LHHVWRIAHGAPRRRATTRSGVRHALTSRMDDRARRAGGTLTVVEATLEEMERLLAQRWGPGHREEALALASALALAMDTHYARTPLPDGDDGSTDALLGAYFSQVRADHRRWLRRTMEHLRQARWPPLLGRASLCACVLSIRDDLLLERKWLGGDDGDGVARSVTPFGRAVVATA